MPGRRRSKSPPISTFALALKAMDLPVDSMPWMVQIVGFEIRRMNRRIDDLIAHLAETPVFSASTAHTCGQCSERRPKKIAALCSGCGEIEMIGPSR